MPSSQTQPTSSTRAGSLASMSQDKSAGGSSASPPADTEETTKEEKWQYVQVDSTNLLDDPEGWEHVSRVNTEHIAVLQHPIEKGEWQFLTRIPNTPELARAHLPVAAFGLAPRLHHVHPPSSSSSRDHHLPLPTPTPTPGRRGAISGPSGAAAPADAKRTYGVAHTPAGAADAKRAYGLTHSTGGWRPGKAALERKGVRHPLLVSRPKPGQEIDFIPI